MVYDPKILIASHGKARVVRYFRSGGKEFLERVDDFSTLRLALSWIFEEDRRHFTPDGRPDGMRRSRIVHGVFNDLGSPVYMELPTKWPNNQWDRKENASDILPELWKHYQESESLIY